jgi:hypothetical protein
MVAQAFNCSPPSVYEWDFHDYEDALEFVHLNREAQALADEDNRPEE